MVEEELKYQVLLKVFNFTLENQAPKMNEMLSIEIPQEFLHKEIKSRMYKEFLAILALDDRSGDKIIYVYQLIT